MTITFDIELSDAKQFLARCWGMMDTYCPQLHAALEDAIESETPEEPATARELEALGQERLSFPSKKERK